MYHRIASPGDVPDSLRPLCVSPARFAEQMEVVASSFRACPVQQSPWGSRSRGSGNVVVTFDDGYADNFLIARGILEQFEIPAEIYVTTDNVAQKTPYWWDQLYYSVKGVQKDELQFALNHRQLAGSTAAARSDLLSNLRLGCDVDADCRPMTIDELTSMSSHPLITIGGHTVSHPRLSQMSAKEQFQEISEGRKQLQEWMGVPIPGFAIPFGGAPDYNSETLRAVRASGFRYCMTTLPGIATHHCSEYELPRFMVMDWDGDTFRKQMENWFLRAPVTGLKGS